MSEVRMVLRGESRTHRFLHARPTFLIAAKVTVVDLGAITVAATLAASLAAFFHGRRMDEESARR